jgi:succinate dehydrogenase / fumarate reductase, iron-sulfur subunit
MGETISLTLKVWRQIHADAPGRFEIYSAPDVDTDMSFLEMIDRVNENLIAEGREPIAFDHDCHEGICGTCGAVVNGQAHGPRWATTLCQLYMRHFRNNDCLVIEPFRARAFPVVRDLVVDRGSLDRVIAAGGYISVKAGSAPEANTIPVPREKAELAMDAAACIGCGACVAACPNASAMLFTAAKVSHLILLPQGQFEGKQRVREMLAQMDREGFGNCSNALECEAACPKKISVANIARMNRQVLAALLSKPLEKSPIDEQA